MKWSFTLVSDFFSRLLVGSQEREAGGVSGQGQIALGVTTHIGSGGIFGPQDEVGQVLVADPLVRRAIIGLVGGRPGADVHAFALRPEQGEHLRRLRERVGEGVNICRNPLRLP